MLARRFHRLSVQFTPENRERLFFHKMAPPILAWITPDTLLLDFTHQPQLAFGDLSATETHWKAPGTGPMHCSLCMLLSHNAPLAHSYIHRPWKCPDALCLREKKKQKKHMRTEVVWLVCMK